MLSNVTSEVVSGDGCMAALYSEQSNDRFTGAWYGIISGMLLRVSANPCIMLSNAERGSECAVVWVAYCPLLSWLPNVVSDVIPCGNYLEMNQRSSRFFMTTDTAGSERFAVQMVACLSPVQQHASCRVPGTYAWIYA
jgi:hypothetical protein